MNFCQEQITQKISTGQKNHLPGTGSFNEHFCESFVKICAMAYQYKCHFAIFPLQVYGNFKLTQQTQLLSNGNKKKHKFVEANTRNISAKSQSYISYGF